MHSKNPPVTPVTYTNPHRFVNQVCRIGKSDFTRDLTVILFVAGYIVGMCYLASFLLAHPLLLALVIVAVATAAVCWVAGGAQ